MFVQESRPKPAARASTGMRIPRPEKKYYGPSYWDPGPLFIQAGYGAYVWYVYKGRAQGAVWAALTDK